MLAVCGVRFTRCHFVPLLSQNLPPQGILLPILVATRRISKIKSLFSSFLYVCTPFILINHSIKTVMVLLEKATQHWEALHYVQYVYMFYLSNELGASLHLIGELFSDSYFSSCAMFWPLSLNPTMSRMYLQIFSI